MVFTDAQLDLIEKEIRVNDAAMTKAAARTHSRRQFRVMDMLPDDWRERVSAMTLTRAERDAADRIYAAVRNYHEPDDVAERVEQVAERWKKHEHRKTVEAQALRAIVRVAKIYRRIEAMLRHAMQLEREQSLLVDVDKVAEWTATLVEHDINATAAFNALLVAKTRGDVEYAAANAIDMAMKYHNRLIELFPDVNVDDAVQSRVCQKPRVGGNGQLLMIVSTIDRRRQRRQAGEKSDSDSESESESESDDDAPTRDIGNVNGRQSLDAMLFSLMWQAFQFFAWEGATNVLATAANLMVAFYQSGTNETFLEQTYMSVGFNGYATSDEVPLNAFLFGDYGTGLYGVASARDQGGIKMVAAVSLSWYRETARFVSRALLQGTDLALSRDRSFLVILLTSVVVRIIVLQVLQIGTRGAAYLYQRTLSRVHHTGRSLPKRELGADRKNAGATDRK